MKCKRCRHYSLYKMITEGPYGYSGPIPCQNCKHFSCVQDNFEPVCSQEGQGGYTQENIFDLYARQNTTQGAPGGTINH